MQRVASKLCDNFFSSQCTAAGIFQAVTAAKKPCIPARIPESSSNRFSVDAPLLHFYLSLSHYSIRKSRLDIVVAKYVECYFFITSSIVKRNFSCSSTETLQIKYKYNANIFR